MLNLAKALVRDEAGFIVSAELVLVSTICVLGLVVGLSEVSSGINQELEDVGAAFGSVNQSYSVQGYCGAKGRTTGSMFQDRCDEGDSENDITCNAAPQAEKCW